MYVFGSGWYGGEGSEWMRGLGLSFTIMWEQGECWTCVRVLVAVVLVGSGQGTWTRVWRGGVVLCLSESGYSV